MLPFPACNLALEGRHQPSNVHWPPSDFLVLDLGVTIHKRKDVSVLFLGFECGVGECHQLDYV